VLEYVRLQWHDGERRLGELPPERRRSFDRVVERLVAELRRRLGGSFTAAELVALYDRSNAWTMPIAIEVAPGEPGAWEQWVADAAFNRYLRDASDRPVRW
jgi:hypothetical protein